STLKSESSSSSANSITSPTSPGELISSRRKIYRCRSSTKPNNHATVGVSRKQSNSLFTASSAPLGILSMLGYNDKKLKQKHLHDNSKPNTDVETTKRPK
ncbi:4104_t:CDS:2, partial [Cetraspora pellucida]